MFGSLLDRLPRLGRWPRLALVGCCLLLALSSALSAHARVRGSRRALVGLVVAARPLTAGTRIVSADVRLARLPAGAAPTAVALHRRSDAIGRRVITAVTRGEPISTTRLLGNDVTSRLPAGLTAVPVQVIGAHVSDLLHPGDRVELFAMPRAGDDADSPSPDQATVLASGLRVLAVLPASDADTGDDPGGAASGEIVVAAPSSTAARITRANLTQAVAAAGQPP